MGSTGWLSNKDFGFESSQRWIPSWWVQPTCRAKAALSFLTLLTLPVFFSNSQFLNKVLSKFQPFNFKRPKPLMAPSSGTSQLFHGSGCSKSSVSVVSTTHVSSKTESVPIGFSFGGFKNYGTWRPCAAVCSQWQDTCNTTIPCLNYYIYSASYVLNACHTICMTIYVNSWY